MKHLSRNFSFIRSERFIKNKVMFTSFFILIFFVVILFFFSNLVIYNTNKTYKLYSQQFYEQANTLLKINYYSLSIENSSDIDKIDFFAKELFATVQQFDRNLIVIKQNLVKEDISDVVILQHDTSGQNLSKNIKLLINYLSRTYFLSLAQNRIKSYNEKISVAAFKYSSLQMNVKNLILEEKNAFTKNVIIFNFFLIALLIIFTVILVIYLLKIIYPLSRMGLNFLDKNKLSS